MKYRINWDYASSLGGPWKEGESVELDDALAEALGNDSPGVLTLDDGDESRAIDAPPENRMIDAPRGKRAKKPLDNEGAMDTSTFKAVRNKS